MKVTKIVNLKYSHHKDEMDKLEVLANIMVVTILQCINVWNPYLDSLKHTQCYVNYISIDIEKKKKKNSLETDVNCFAQSRTHCGLPPSNWFLLPVLFPEVKCSSHFKSLNTWDPFGQQVNWQWPHLHWRVRKQGTLKIWVLQERQLCPTEGPFSRGSKEPPCFMGSGHHVSSWILIPTGPECHLLSWPYPFPHYFLQPLPPTLLSPFLALFLSYLLPLFILLPSEVKYTWLIYSASTTRTQAPSKHGFWPFLGLSDHLHWECTWHTGRFWSIFFKWMKLKIIYFLNSLYRSWSFTTRMTNPKHWPKEI